MESVSRNVVLDLLPVYISGEASEESRALVEEYAKKDTEIAKLIRSGELESAELSLKQSPPDDLEIKAIKRLRNSIRRQMAYVAIATASILMIPLIAMFFTNEVNWTIFDFIVMGILLSGTGLTYVFITKISDNIAYRAAVGIAVVTGFLLIWMNLAVGIIGSEDNQANLLYVGVLAVGIIGSIAARFKARGMAYTLFAAAIVQMLVPVAAILIWQPSLDNLLGILGVFALNAFFAALFTGSGLLFRYAAKKNN